MENDRVFMKELTENHEAQNRVLLETKTNKDKELRKLDQVELADRRQWERKIEEQQASIDNVRHANQILLKKIAKAEKRKEESK